MDQMPAARSINLTIPGFFRDKLAVAKEAFENWTRERERRRRADLLRVFTPWQRFWGDEYGLGIKERALKPVFEKLESEGKIGDLIVDVGSGARPVTRFIKPAAGRKRILVDVAADNEISGDEQRIRLDVEKVGEFRSLAFLKAAARARKFLDLAPGTGPERADTMIFTDILNYVDFRKVLGAFACYLKPGGRLIIMNLPMRGNESLFSDQGLKDNTDLCEWLQAGCFEIEHKAFPYRPSGETAEAEELIVLVARKRGGE
jgi:SAM-dependent methyltransferase